MSLSTTLPLGMTAIDDLDAAWETPSAGPRLRAVRVAAERLRDRFAAGPRVVAVRTLPLTTLLYPTKYAFHSSARSPAPFVVLTHRAILVQFLQAGALKNLLFNPTDIEAARATPYLARLGARFGERTTNFLVQTFEPIEGQLIGHGLTVADIDYLAFDHFHTQDLRGVLGTEDGTRAARFPNATLIAPAREWSEWDDPHPCQRAWFIARGDFALGDGVILVRTPGHTEGNQTLFLNTEEGVWGISENGTSADSWSPLDSRIPGLKAACRANEVDLVMNANTLAAGADQYTSMVLERTFVDRVRRAPAFVQMFPSSEVTPSRLAPGLKPTLLHRAVTSGDVVRGRKRDAA
jgi:hypothetical protein